jgi:hypothetical protein
MARRITRAESVGLPAPNIEGLREALATFLDELAQTEKRIAEFLATGLYSDSKALADAGPLRDQAYHDDAVRQIGVDLGWTLALEGRESELDEVRQIFRAQLAKVVDERNASIENGWRYKDERQVLADRERFWEAAEPELSRWVTEAGHERDRMLRGGTGARLGRAIRRLVVRN